MAERARALSLTGDLIVMSRLLVLQTRRRLLASSQKDRGVANAGHDILAEVTRLSAAANKAHAEYKKAVLDWAAPETSQFSMVSYAAMIDGLEELAGKLRTSSQELPTQDRADLDADVDRLDEIIGRWRASMMSSMGGSAG